MSALLDIPFVLTLATWAWGGESDDPMVGPEVCIESLPFMNGGCWNRLIAKALGIAIIAGAFLNKVPIMLNIINSKSAEGLSRSSLYGDTVVIANGAFYGFLEGYPLTAYGENMALLLQTVVIILMIWHYDKTIGMQEHLLVTGVAAGYVVAVGQILPSEYHYILPASIWPILIFSRGTQIWETYTIKHTGSLSIITTSLNVAGSVARIFTTIAEVGWDMVMLSGFFLSSSLNIIMAVQYFLYKKNTEAFLKELRKKKE